MDSAGGLNASRRKKGMGMRRPDSVGKKTNDTTVMITPQKALVWVKENDSLVQKKIIIGLNDDTHVQVLHGLTTDDEVVDAVQNPALEPQTSSAPAKSPFMPQRRGSASPKRPPQAK